MTIRLQYVKDDGKLYVHHGEADEPLCTISYPVKAGADGSLFVIFSNEDEAASLYELLPDNVQEGICFYCFGGYFNAFALNELMWWHKNNAH